MLPVPLQFRGSVACGLGRVLQQEVDYLMAGPFREIVQGGGVKIVLLPARSPNLNAFAERFVLSIKSECLERMVPLGERHLRLAISEYMRDYHLERNHQGLGNALIKAAGDDDSVGGGPVVRRDRIGGLLHFYHRRAVASGRAE